MRHRTFCWEHPWSRMSSLLAPSGWCVALVPEVNGSLYWWWLVLIALMRKDCRAADDGQHWLIRFEHSNFLGLQDGTVLSPTCQGWALCWWGVECGCVLMRLDCAVDGIDCAVDGWLSCWWSGLSCCWIDCAVDGWLSCWWSGLSCCWIDCADDGWTVVWWMDCADDGWTVVWWMDCADDGWTVLLMDGQCWWWMDWAVDRRYWVVDGWTVLMIDGRVLLIYVLC